MTAEDNSPMLNHDLWRLRSESSLHQDFEQTHHSVADIIQSQVNFVRSLAKKASDLRDLVRHTGTGPGDRFRQVNKQDFQSHLDLCAREFNIPANISGCLNEILEWMPGNDIYFSIDQVQTSQEVRVELILTPWNKLLRRFHNTGLRPDFFSLYARYGPSQENVHAISVGGDRLYGDAACIGTLSPIDHIRLMDTLVNIFRYAISVNPIESQSEKDREIRESHFLDKYWVNVFEGQRIETQHISRIEIEEDQLAALNLLFMDRRYKLPLTKRALEVTQQLGLEMDMSLRYSEGYDIGNLLFRVNTPSGDIIIGVKEHYQGYENMETITLLEQALKESDLTNAERTYLEGKRDVEERKLIEKLATWLTSKGSVLSPPANE